MKKYKVPEYVRLKASRCVHDFSCISGGHCGEKLMCKVERTVDGVLAFLEEKEVATCSCRTPFGGSQLCMCPVRAYIFDHYGE